MLQVGGGDQWGNITSGCEFVRKKTGHLVHGQYKHNIVLSITSLPTLSVLTILLGITVPLLTTAAGEKLGKSVGNAVSLSSSYSLYQSLLQTGDREVGAWLSQLTFIPLEEVENILEQQAVRGNPCTH